MRKVLVAFAALVLCAAPAVAQETADAPAQVAAVKAAPAPAPAQADVQKEQPAAPSLAISSEDVKERVRVIEEQRTEAQMSQSFWYTVAAVAIGVIIALLLLD